MSLRARVLPFCIVVLGALSFGAAPISAQQPAAETPAAEKPAPAEKGVEVIIVTARKKEESVQDIPIAVSAFSAEGLETSNIDDVADIQFNVPNLSFSKTNFSGAGNISLRGVGNLAVAATSENGTGIHVNSAPFPGSRIFETEFYDVDRVEVLRGPQGTLFGRSAPAGALNIFTKKPVFGDWGGYAEGSYGLFNHGKVKAALNVPLGEHFAARFAGYFFHRDGTTLNTFNDKHLDGREVYALRGSLAGEWDAVNFNLMVQWFDESDNRMRINKQACARDTGTWPATLGCRGDSLGSDPINDQALLGYELGILSDTLLAVGWPGVQRFLNGPLGVLNPAPTSLADRLVPANPGCPICGIPTSMYANSRTPASLRHVSTQLDPKYTSDEFQTTLEVNFNLNEDITLTSVTGYHLAHVDSRTDYFWNVPSETLGSGPRHFDFPGSGDGPGKSLAGTYDSEFVFDRSGSQDDLFTQELRLTTAFDGPVNVTAGAIYNEAKVKAWYYVYGASLEAFWDLPFDPFGSCSVDASGNKVPSVFVGGLPGVAAAGPRRTGQSCHDIFPDTSYYLNETKPTTASSYAIFGELYWDVFEKTRLTVGARYTDDQKTDRQRVNLFVCEVKSFDPITGDLTCDKEPFVERKGGWTQVTWKVSIDQHFDLPFAPNSLAYATVSTGYKGGGFNPAVSCAQSGGGCATVSPLFDQEEITAYEVGYKGLLFERMQLNLTGFYYDYKGMQISKIVSRTAVNENIDSKIWGVEAETVALLTDALTIDLNVSYLNTEIQNADSIDTANPTANRPGWIAVKHDGLDGSNAVCLVAVNPTCQSTGPVGSYFVDGFPTSLKGNELPGSPDWSVKVGAQYVFPIYSGWEATPRVDYYWRGDSWGRIYNTGKDKIGTWQQVDVQMRFTKEGSPLTFELWGKNLQNNDDVTGHYFTDATSANFTNLFILEPRTYGATIRYTWGESEH